MTTALVASYTKLLDLGMPRVFFDVAVPIFQRASLSRRHLFGGHQSS